MYHSLVSYLIGPDHLSLANLLFEVHPPQLLGFLRQIFQTTSETLLVIVKVLILLLNMTMSPRGGFSFTPITCFHQAVFWGLSLLPLHSPPTSSQLRSPSHVVP